MARKKDQNPHAFFGASAVPLYLQLAAEFRQRIEQGQWQIGDALPSIEELKETYSVSRITIRQAIKLLSDDGLVSAQRGRGTFVTGEGVIDRQLRVETSLDKLVEMYRGDTPDHSNIYESAEAPLVNEEDGILAPKYFHMRRMHARDGINYCVISLYIEDNIFRCAPTRFRKEVVLPVLVSIPDLTISKAHQTLKIFKADLETANLLDIPVGEPMAGVRRVMNDAEGKIIYFANVIYRGDYIHLDMDLLT